MLSPPFVSKEVEAVPWHRSTSTELRPASFYPNMYNLGWSWVHRSVSSVGMSEIYRLIQVLS